MTQTKTRPRVHQLDALRGFAMCGIVFMNILQITGMPQLTGTSAELPAATAFGMAFTNRFLPIFAFLFGLSFALFLDSAKERHDKPRLLLVRRLVVLALLGLAHALLQPGEVLRWYAVFGLLVLLPASYLRRRWMLVLGIVLVAVPTVLAARGFFILGPTLIPGLFLLGMAAFHYGLAHSIERRTRQLLVAFGVGVVVAVGAGWWEYAGGPRNLNRVEIAGLAFAFVYAVGYVLLLRTPLGRPLGWVFEPLGRMALTNYLLATVLIVLADLLIRFDQRAGAYGAILALGVSIGLVQAVLSRLWLRDHRYGPAEWAWRCLTWWQRVPLRRAGSEAGVGERRQAGGELDDTVGRHQPRADGAGGEAPGQRVEGEGAVRREQ
ncbi:putative membrane protein YeiB [Tenggerimyces flavus]|nr:putative membrane protein YeiB [Tenggerimyces flavus]